MAYDEGLAEILRGDLEQIPGISERRMFGGLAFLLDGHMVAGVLSTGGMFRVGKSRETQARAIPGTGPMTFTGRPMGGLVEVTDDLLADDDRRTSLLALALENARTLSPK